MSVLHDLVLDIYAKRLMPQSHRVIRHLVELMNLDDALAKEIVQAFDDNEAVSNPELQTRLWTRIEELELGEQGPYRTLVPLLQPDEAIDGYFAEFLIDWIAAEGVSEQAIEMAFRRLD